MEANHKLPVETPMVHLNLSTKLEPPKKCKVHDFKEGFTPYHIKETTHYSWDPPYKINDSMPLRRCKQKRFQDKSNLKT